MIKQHILKAISLIILLAILLMPLTGALAQEEPTTETFDDEALSGWDRAEGAVVQDGVLRISPGSFAAKFGEFGDGTLSVKVKQSAPGAVFIRYFMGESGSYALIIFPDGILLEKSLEDQPQELGGYEWTSSTGEWVEFKITISSGQHTVYLDGQQIIQAMDDNPLQGGGIGFMVEGETTVDFDDFSLSAIVFEGLPPAEEGAPPAEGEQPEVPADAEAAAPVDIPASETAGSRVSISDLIADLTSSQANPLELSTFIINLLLSVVLSYILSRVYVHWGSSLSNRRRFAANFILITVTTTFIILVVRSSVALSLGLVGALSIVRFRAAIKEPEELAYLFFAISIGIGLGDNQRIITILAMVVAILILGLMRLFRGRQADFNLHVTVASHTPNKIELESIMDVLTPHCSQVKLMRFDDSGITLESSFLVEFRNMAALKHAKAALRGLSDALEITFLDNKGIW
ncbi:MAG: DUF4956 domain-containing protein [Anaerolineales bacterium]|nr:DUF4956 domain-containing protein [Chloroflexota bacterium]MBL6983453.1 DUF4956 domain-containing protein [Anaerolineales bacterium]